MQAQIWRKPNNTSDTEAHLEPPNAAQSFIMGGISAARHSAPPQRGGILSDVAHVLGCKAEALRFLIEPCEAAHDHFDFPDSERRRHIGRKNQLNIAE